MSGTGKTSLACALLPHLPRFAAIKVTIQDLGTKVTDEEGEIMVPGKDSYRLKMSGASKVVWVQSSEEELSEAMGFAWSMIGEVEGTIIEGNSILEHVKPDLTFFVVDREMDVLKPSRVSALKKANVVVINKKVEGLEGKNIEKTIQSFNPQALILSIDQKENNSNLLAPILNRYLGLRAHNP